VARKSEKSTLHLCFAKNCGWVFRATWLFAQWAMSWRDMSHLWANHLSEGANLCSLISLPHWLSHFWSPKEIQEHSPFMFPKKQSNRFQWQGYCRYKQDVWSPQINPVFFSNIRILLQEYLWFTGSVPERLKHFSVYNQTCLSRRHIPLQDLSIVHCDHEMAGCIRWRRLEERKLSF
jgi:hypothetical protein